MLVSAILLGVLAGIGFGGDWKRITRLKFQGLPILLASGLVRLAGVLWGMPLVLYVLVLCSLLVVAFLNRRLPGALLLGAGVALNLIAILANGGMPISPQAAAIVGLEIPRNGLHHPMTEATQLQALVDVIPAPVFRNVYSAGDVVLAAGGFWLPFAVLRRGRDSVSHQ